MNFNDLLREVKEQKANGAKTMHNQTEIMTGAVPQLQKHEMVALKSSVCVFFKELQTPFNPLDPTDDSFNSTRKFVVKAAPSVFVKAMKEAMLENEELHAFYAKFIKKTAEEYDISNPDVVTDDDFAIFNKFTVPAHFSADTQKILTAEAGKYGRECLSPLSRNEDGELVDMDKYLFGRLVMLEREIRNEKVAEFLKDNDKNSLNSDQKERLTTIRRSAKVTMPKKSGVILFLEFEGKTDKDGGSFVLNPIKTGANLDEFLRYYNCNADELKKINKRLGKKKVDKFLDYIILKIEYGDNNEQGTSPELALYKSREYENIEFYFDDEESKEDPHTLFSEPEDFDNAITAYVDDGLAGRFERVVRRNIFKFRNISDQDLRELYVTRLVEIKPYITAETLTMFGSEIEAISPVVKKELDKLKEENKLRISAKKLVSSDDTLTQIGTAIESLDELDKLDSENNDVVDQDIDAGEDLKDILGN